MARILIIDFVEHAPEFDDVLIHFERIGPGADKVPDFERFALVRRDCRA